MSKAAGKRPFLHENPRNTSEIFGNLRFRLGVSLVDFVERLGMTVKLNPAEILNHEEVAALTKWAGKASRIINKEWVPEKISDRPNLEDILPEKIDKAIKSELLLLMSKTSSQSASLMENGKRRVTGDLLFGCAKTFYQQILERFGIEPNKLVKGNFTGDASDFWLDVEPEEVVEDPEAWLEDHAHVAKELKQQLLSIKNATARERVLQMFALLVYTAE